MYSLSRVDTTTVPSHPAHRLRYFSQNTIAESVVTYYRTFQRDYEKFAVIFFDIHK